MLGYQFFPYEGGIKSTNLLRTLHGAVSESGHTLDGVAIVSDIVASPDPELSAHQLSTIFRAFKQTTLPKVALSRDPDTVLESVLRLMETIKTLNPLVHQVRSCALDGPVYLFLYIIDYK